MRTIDSPPFELEESGYGGFNIGVKLYFQPIASEKWQQKNHYLQLDPYGDEVLMAEQARTGIVRMEVAEFVEFNEPTEGLWDALTSDSQWEYMAPPSRGKGKGKIAQTILPPMSMRNMDLPDRSQPGSGSVYSRETEEALLEILNAAVQKTQVETERTLRKSKDVNDELNKIKETSNVDAKLQELHAKIPPKKK